MLVTFHNVRISIDCVDEPKEAYDELCNAMAGIGEQVDWETDTYTTAVDDEPESPPRSTSELFPK